MCSRKGGEGWGRRRQKASCPQTRMCVGFKKVQSDDLQSPDSLCNTFTEAGEEGETQPPFSIPLIIPRYLHTAFQSEMSTGSRRCPAAACHWHSPVVTCKVCCFSPWCGLWLLGMLQLPSCLPSPPPSSISLWKIAQTHAGCNKNQIWKLLVSKEKGMKLSYIWKPNSDWKGKRNGRKKEKLNVIVLQSFN